MSINIDDLTLGQIKDVQRIAGCTPLSAPAPRDAYTDKIGKSVFIRSVTNHYTGRLVTVTDGELVIEDAAWIADSGRWAAALSSGTLGEVEPYPDGPVIVNRGAIADVCLWPHALPRSVK